MAAIVGSIDAKKDMKGPVAASSLRASGELKIFGCVLDKSQVALTDGAKILDLADAKIKGNVRVGPQSAARASIELEAKTSLGMLRLSLIAEGVEGDESDAPIDVGGVKAIVHVRIAKKQGCLDADCPPR